MKSGNASQLTTYQLVQAVLSHQHSEKAGEMFGLDKRGSTVLVIALNTVNENGEFGDLAKALKAAGLHFSLIRTLKANSIITRKDDGPWMLTKSAIKKLTQMAGGEATVTADQGGVVESQLKDGRVAEVLGKLTLPEIGAYVKGRLTDIDEQMKTVEAESERAIEEI